MAPTNIQRLRQITVGLLILCLILAGILAYGITTTLHTVHTTGILEVSASEPNAAITISQVDHAAAPIGISSARVRLKPGDYLIGANASGLSAVTTVHITTQHTSKVNLNLTKNHNNLPSVENVGFVNMDVLVTDGLTSTQATSIKEQFFTYKTSAKVVSIDAASVEPAAHNPDSYDPFVLNFTGNIDSVPFRGVVTYTGYDNAQLTIYDAQTGAQLYIGPGLSD